MSQIKKVGWTWMTLNTFRCNCLTPLHFRGLKSQLLFSLHSVHWFRPVFKAD